MGHYRKTTIDVLSFLIFEFEQSVDLPSDLQYSIISGLNATENALVAYAV